MNNPFQRKTWSIGFIILIVWLVFSILFVGRALWNYSVNNLYASGVQRGQDSAITQIISLGRQCQPVQLFSGRGADRLDITLVNPACTAEQIQQAQQQAASVQTPPAEKPVQEVPETVEQ
ncbi:hypothetical protein HN954_02450 [bacterium]|nr:hypothetical protein [bacterium]MBT6831621.1 hypothetical protein [bacterium]MBT6996266.1 hypothetical protein [bacterium]MBT7772944.1 hypothetical protein [bacterium]